jgi:hypothetical protein
MMAGRFKFGDNPGLLQDFAASADPDRKKKEDGTQPPPMFMGDTDPSFLMKLIAQLYGMESYPGFANEYREAYPPGYTPPGRTQQPTPSPTPRPIIEDPLPIGRGIDAVNESKAEEIARLKRELGI